MSYKELERFPVFQLYTQPALCSGPHSVDTVLRKNRTHFFDNDSLQQHYEDDERESRSEIPIDSENNQDFEDEEDVAANWLKERTSTAAS